MNSIDINPIALFCEHPQFLKSNTCFSIIQFYFSKDSISNIPVTIEKNLN